MRAPWDRGRWQITVERTAIRATIARHGRIVWQGECPWAQVTDLPDALGRLTTEAEVRPMPRSAEICIAPPVLQRRTLGGLPPVRPRALRALVAHQTTRFFRQNGHPLVVDAVWARVAKGAPRIAHAVAAEEAVVAAALDGALRAGLRVEAVRPADPSGAGHLDLLPPSARAANDRQARHEIRRLAWAVASLWVLIGASALVRFEREERRVDAELSRLAAPLAALLTARREMGKAEAMLRAIQESDVQRSRVPLLARAVAQSLPDSAFFTSLTIDLNGAGLLSGVAAKPLEVVAGLERTPSIVNPRLQGGTVREAVGGEPWDRFTVVFGGGARP